MGRSRFRWWEVDAKGKTVAISTRRQPEVTGTSRSGGHRVHPGDQGNKIYVIGQVNKPGEFIMNPSVTSCRRCPYGGTTPFAALGDIPWCRTLR
jgi:hypothetical protein